MFIIIYNNKTFVLYKVDFYNNKLSQWVNIFIIFFQLYKNYIKIK